MNYDYNPINHKTSHLSQLSVSGPGPACSFEGAEEGERQVRVAEDTLPGEERRQL